MKTLKEQVIHIPESCMMAAVNVLRQIHSQALIIGSNELAGTIAVKITYDASSPKSVKAISNLDWFKESLDEYLQGEDVLPFLSK